MSRFVLTGVVDGKKIQAIKGVRQATGVGLKEAKDLVDAVESGDVLLPPTCAGLADTTVVRLLEEHACRVRVELSPLDLEAVVAFLGGLPSEMSVGAVHAVLLSLPRGSV